MDPKSDTRTTMTVQQIMARYDKSSVYVKRALQRGWLKGHKAKMEGTEINQWVAYVDDIEAWRKAAEQHKAPRSRFAGTDRQIADLEEYLAHASPAEVEKVRKSLVAKAK